MTLAMLWVLIALVLIALIPLVKRLLRSINGDP